MVLNDQSLIESWDSTSISTCPPQIWYIKDIHIIEEKFSKEFAETVTAKDQDS